MAGATQVALSAGVPTFAIVLWTVWLNVRLKDLIRRTDNLQWHLDSRFAAEDASIVERLRRLEES